MPKPSISGRVPQTLKDDFDEYCEENELSITDAQRELLRAGLAAKKYDEQDAADEPDEAASEAPAGVLDRAGGGAMASVVAFTAAHNFVGDVAAMMVGVAVLGVATYMVAVATIREARRSSDDSEAAANV